MWVLVLGIDYFSLILRCYEADGGLVMEMTSCGTIEESPYKENPSWIGWILSTKGRCLWI